MGWLRVRELVRKEFIQLFRDRKNRPLLVIAPLVQLIVFGYVVTTDVRDIRVGLIDKARTPESRQFIEAIDANPTFRITHFLAHPAQLESLLAPSPGGPGHHHPAGLYGKDKERRERRGPDIGRWEHEQHGVRSHRLHIHTARAVQQRTHPGASQNADRLRGSGWPHSDLVQSQPLQRVLLRSRDRGVSGDAVDFAFHLHGRCPGKRGRHHGAADRDPSEAFRADSGQNHPLHHHRPGPDGHGHRFCHLLV